VTDAEATSYAPDDPLPGARSPRDAARQIPPGNHGLPPEKVLSLQRERLIDAIVHVIGERGYTATSVEAVCKCAGVSTKAFYRSFRDIDDLFSTAFEIGKEALFHRATTAFTTGGPEWQGRVRSALSSFLATLAENPNLARLCIVDAAIVYPSGTSLLVGAMSQSFQMFVEVSPTIDMPIPFEDLTTLVIGGIITRLYFYILEGRTRDMPELLEELTYFALLPFIGPDAAAAQYRSL
jgi:AcrR family transcriptional regulator